VLHLKLNLPPLAYAFPLILVCKPNVQNMNPPGTGFQSIMYTRDVCTGDEKEINDSLESFPSGHSTAAFAGFVYLSLYLSRHYSVIFILIILKFSRRPDAQLKVMSDHRPAYWKYVLIFAPLLGATLIAGSLTIDQCTTLACLQA
jgi:diacylglycerol diphosphate phosphatase / phosphatidate phosphatase